jgi:hypothetical protein
LFADAVKAVRVQPNSNDFVVSGPIGLGAENESGRPRVTFNSNSWFVAWRRLDVPERYLEAKRIDLNGQVLDQRAIRVAAFPGSDPEFDFELSPVFLSAQSKDDFAIFYVDHRGSLFLRTVSPK